LVAEDDEGELGTDVADVMQTSGEANLVSGEEATGDGTGEVRCVGEDVFGLGTVPGGNLGRVRCQGLFLLLATSLLEGLSL